MTDIESIFDRTAEDYDRFVSPCRVCQFLVLAHEMGFKGSEKVLDLGSGPGLLSAHVAGLLDDGEVVGVDLSDRMVKLASQRAHGLGLNNLRFVRGDAMNLDLPQGAFDAVVSSYLLHWVPDMGRCFAEIRRVLKDDGRLGIMVPSPARYSELREAYSNVASRCCEQDSSRRTNEMVGLRVMLREELLSALRSAGFEVEKDFELNLKERLSAAACLDRVNAITWARYLEAIPTAKRDRVRNELLREFERNCSSGLLTTECSIFVIAKRQRGNPA
ncbi:MAG: class I SAM-dependent methyltransferase [Nitrososphaerota archaeon]|nr:class I SAM-dependent methyltransferase [Nitrososphaerota archaeon]MDG6973596.1 class I SAM-dependent methyltransferase [Nitrososphaerota archaeon]MDG6987380.1 class I SAM-dependent methyltransferase [Nitrososphaerota archaeon]